MTTHYPETADLIPTLTDDAATAVTGESTLAEYAGSPLTTSGAYLALLICTAGCARMTINFRPRTVRQGDILLLAEDTITQLQSRSRGFRVFFCLMPKTFSAEVAYQLPDSLFLFLHEFPRCRPEARERPLLRIWLTQMEDIALHGSRYRRLMQQNHLQNLFLRIAERMPPEALAVTQAYSRKEKLGWQFWDLTGQHSGRHRDVQFYAGLLNITPFYLSQITRELFNDSPKALINRRVLLRIKALLRYSRLTAEQIADALNFADPSYLNRYFRRETGLSLTAYRRREEEKKKG